MGQVQRDDRRNAGQETIELWEIGLESPKSSRAGQSRQAEWPGQRQRRQSKQTNESRQDRQYRQTGKPRQINESRQNRQYRQTGKPRQINESRQDRQYRQTGKPRQTSESLQMRQPGQLRQSQRPRPAAYRRKKELQFVLPVDEQQSGNPRPVQSMKRRRARRRKVLLSRAMVFVFIVLCLVLIYQTTGAVYRFIHRDMMGEAVEKDEGLMNILSNKVDSRKIAPPEILVDYLDINDYSRPGTELKKIKSVFVHYTANPGTSAKQNRSYFANLAQTHERSASAHFIIGYEGELIQCIPLDEQAYAVATRNEDSISIECCYLAEDGSFTPETYETLLHTLAWLLKEYNLTTQDILRHYDCGGKKCPLYYVNHEDAWEKLLADVETYEAPIDSEE